MNNILNNKELQKKRICVFGAGMAGSVVYNLLKMQTSNDVVIMDNNPQKKEESEKYAIEPIDVVIEKYAPEIYLIAFWKYNQKQYNEAREFLKDRSVKDEQIIDVLIRDELVDKLGVELVMNTLQSLEKKKRSEKEDSNIVIVGNNYKKSDDNKVGGGTIGAVNMQRILLGESYKNSKIRIMYYPDKYEDIFEYRFTKYSYILNSINYLAKQIDDDNDVYICNDIFSACTLGELGQKYVMIYHGQGDMVTDMNAFGAGLSENGVKLIRYIEKKAIENAQKVYFPSKGARKYFLETFSDIDIEETEPMYNCIYDYPKLKYEKRKISIDELSFLSIGQLTRLKGMDLIPEILEKIHICTQKDISWKIVAKGELKEEIKDKISSVNNKYGREVIRANFIEEFIDHNKIYELMSTADIYIMMHRISIFDFSTLEAMYMGMPIILSNIEGNKEFNRNDNILLVDEKTNKKQIMHFVDRKEIYAQRNREVYENYFSEEAFLDRYHLLIEDLLKNNGA